MKNLITTIASLIIITTFISQIVANEETYLRLYISDAIMEKYEDNWNEEGTISLESQNLLKKDLSKYTNGMVELLSIKQDNTDEAIYEVSLAYKNVIGPAKVIGFNGDNKAERVKIVYVKSRKTEDEDKTEDKERSEVKNDEKEEKPSVENEEVRLNE